MNKKILCISRADLTIDVAWTKKCVATWQRVNTPPGDTDVFAHVCARACACDERD